MVGINWRQTAVKVLGTLLATSCLVLGLTSCSGDRTSALPPISKPTPAVIQSTANISEVSPPEGLQQLRQLLEVYQPQVTIVNPRPNQVLQDDRVKVELQIRDLPLFKDPKLGLGPHLEVILDNQPVRSVYNLQDSLTLENLTPGSHTLRVFAARPWFESFKNEGAYAQTTFHVFTKTQENAPNPALPLLTYSSPAGTYGAEPILLDFYLTNAPLHVVAQEKSDDDILDWRIRATINGESFIIDQWQPLYLKGFKPGKNWVQLELLNELGNPILNEFNNTVRLVNYEPKGKDPLAKLMRGDLSVAQARMIVDPNAIAPSPTPTPTPVVTPTPTPTPVVTPTPTPSPTPVVTPTPTPTPVVIPTPTPTPVVIPTPTPILEPITPKVKPSPEPSETPTPLPVKEPINRYRTPVPPLPSPQTETPVETPQPVAVPTPTPTETPVTPPVVTPKASEKSPGNQVSNFFRKFGVEIPGLSSSPKPVKPLPSETSTPTPTSEPIETLPEILPSASSETPVLPSESESTPNSASPEPTEATP